MLFRSKFMDANAEKGSSQNVSGFMQQEAGDHEEAKYDAEPPAVGCDADNGADGDQNPAGLMHAERDSEFDHKSFAHESSVGYR